MVLGQYAWLADGVSCSPEVAGWDFDAIDHVLPDDGLQIGVAQVSKATMPEFCRLGPWVDGQGCRYVPTAWDVVESVGSTLGDCDVSALKTDGAA